LRFRPAQGKEYDVERADGRGYSIPLHRRRTETLATPAGEMQALHIAKCATDPKTSRPTFGSPSSAISCRCACSSWTRTAPAPTRCHAHRQVTGFSRPLRMRARRLPPCCAPTTRRCDAPAFFRSHPKIDSATAHDADSVYAALRRRRLLERVARRHSPRRLRRDLDRAPRREIARARPLAARDESSGRLRKARRGRAAAVRGRVELPDWRSSARAPTMKARCSHWRRAMLQNAPLDLRVNPLKISREAVLERLAATGLPPPRRRTRRRESASRRACNQRHPLFWKVA